MIIRNKNFDTVVSSRVQLLDFLRGVSNKNGVVKDDVSVFVPVRLSMSNEQLTMSGGNDCVVPWTFSTFDLDRFDERVDPKGWELSHFKRNPVIQWAHRFDIPAIGRASDLTTDDDGLHGNIIFNDKEFDAFGWSIGERVRRGVLSAGSVGFRILEVELPNKEAQTDGTTLIFRRQELLEFSICNVPANPFALSSPQTNDTKTVSSVSTSNKDITGMKRKSDDAFNFWGGLLQ